MTIPLAAPIRSRRMRATSVRGRILAALAFGLALWVAAVARHRHATDDPAREGTRQDTEGGGLADPPAEGAAVDSDEADPADGTVSEAASFDPSGPQAIFPSDATAGYPLGGTRRGLAS